MRALISILLLTACCSTQPTTPEETIAIELEEEPLIQMVCVDGNGNMNGIAANGKFCPKGFDKFGPCCYWRYHL